MRVFYEDWQMGCCGTPFAVGDEVAWKLVAYDAENVREGYGHGAEAWVENHGGPDHPTTGRVHAVDLVHQEYSFHLPDPRPAPVEAGEGLVLRGMGRCLEPVPGAVTLEPVGSCPKWFGEVERDPVDGLGRVRRTCGALVTLDAPDTTHVLQAPYLPDGIEDDECDDLP
ncbi:hypothetical protein GCM10010260_07940 [Streptomyces filipinensis]|uniref:Uncharacterized protein n=1 Tax=Streptomyces filipinensis TaxID=66887 RepID=A0A918I7V0_9ACTN|nr:DUF6578 domain-containing protein [Streptomyces filipinensis]GGU77950.1 hypothetical protein GCM10010260_07940 [Streptomyces filipinensis]